MSNKDKEKDYNKKMKNLLMEVKGIVEETRYNNIPLAFFLLDKLFTKKYDFR